MVCFAKFDCMSDLVNYCNDYNPIRKNDIVQIFYDGRDYVLVYEENADK